MIKQIERANKEKDMSDKNSKKKIKTSPLRIIIGVIIFLLLFYAVSFADNYLTTLPHHKDYTPIWTKDGNGVIFTRWHQPMPGKADYFEIIKTNTDGSANQTLFQSPAGYNVFNIRRLLLSSDGKFINLRLNKQEGDNMRDILYKIPIDKTQKTETWELEKKYIFDVFLAFRDDKVILRKMTENGKVASSILQICRFSDKSVISEIPYKDRKIVCVYADFYGKDQKPLILNRIIRGKDVTDSVNELLLPDDKKSLTMKVFPFDIHYLEKENIFIGIEMSAAHIFHIIDPNTNTIRTLANPAGKDSQVSMNDSQDPSEILIGDSNNVFRINPKDGKVEKTALSTGLDGAVQESADRKVYLYSDGTGIYTINRDGTGFRNITELSPLAKMMKNDGYRSYMAKRSAILHMASEEHHESNSDH
jgi:hypothetical protein